MNALRFSGALAIGAGFVLAYTRLVRPWYSNWGASADEIVRPMPLDDRVPEPTIVTTRAVTVNARPADIWPWIAQMGEAPRAGFYSYTWVERMQGMDVHNARRIMPEFQDIQAGDSLDKAGNMLVLDAEPGRHVVLGPPDTVDWLKSTWAIALYPLDENRTRVVTRVRARFSIRVMLKSTPPASWPWLLLLDAGVFVMERKMLLEIKRLAEGRAELPARTAPASAAP